MNCFNHQDKPAVGLCQSCGKGLCEACLAELPNGLACKGSCEKQANVLCRGAESDAETNRAARQRLWTTGVWCFLGGMELAVVIGACAVMTYFWKDNFLIAMGAYVIALSAPLAISIPVAIYQLLTGIVRFNRQVRHLPLKNNQ